MSVGAGAGAQMAGARADKGRRWLCMDKLINMFKAIRRRMLPILDVLIFWWGFMNVVIPPSSGHDPFMLLLSPAIAVFLLSVRCFSWRFLDVAFFIFSLVSLLTFGKWSCVLLEWLFKKRGLL